MIARLDGGERRRRGEWAQDRFEGRGWLKIAEGSNLGNTALKPAGRGGNPGEELGFGNRGVPELSKKKQRKERRFSGKIGGNEKVQSRLPENGHKHNQECGVERRRKT